MAGLIAAGSVPDAGAFLSRLTRLDPAALVRLRPLGPDAVALWGRLPWGVLVTRGLRGAAGAGVAGPADVTVRAGELLAALPAGVPALPARRDADWRWPLPPGPGRSLERLPAAELRRAGAAAAETLRAAAASGVGGRAVGQRALRDALLDHVAVVVDAAGGERVEVPQRLVQAVLRMGFLADGDVYATVLLAGRWVGIAGDFGTGWYVPAGGGLGLSVRP